MSIYLPPASVRIKAASSRSLSALRRSPLMARILTLTLVNVSSVAAALNLLCKQKMRKTLQLEPLVQLKLARLVTELELIPVSRNRQYISPCCSSILYYAAFRSESGAVLDIYKILSDESPS